MDFLRSPQKADKIKNAKVSKKTQAKGFECQSPATNQSKPPSYNDSLATSATHSIKASDNPQWLWSQSECRTWIKEVCIHYFDFTLDEALAASENFKGMRASLFQLRGPSWEEIIPGPYATALYSLIFSRRAEQGAVPKNITFPHWQANKKKLRCLCSCSVLGGDGTFILFESWSWF